MTVCRSFPDCEVQRLLFHRPSVVASAPKGWAADFARSIAAQSRRRGWRPTPKQREIMLRMVAELFTSPDDQEGDHAVIED